MFSQENSHNNRAIARFYLKKSLYSTAFATLLFAFSASTTAAMMVKNAEQGDPAEREETVACPKDETKLQTVETRHSTAMVGLYPCWSANETNNNYRYLSDLYAHWSVREIRGLAGAPREYGRERRSAIIRLIVGKNLSLVSSIRIDLRDPDMTFIIPLATFAYQGRVGKGETWSTSLVADDQTQPFFRIGPTTSAKIDVSANSTTEIEVKATSSILNALRNLTAVVTPGASLITTLNRESLQQTSNALDSALSSIWSESQDEQQSSGRQLSEWYESSGFLIQLELPDFIKTAANHPTDPSKTDAVTGRNRPKGRTTTSRWYFLTLSCPRYSIFDVHQACAKADETKADGATGLMSNGFKTAISNLQNRISPEQVNNYKLASGKTLHQYLSDQDWYARFLRKGDIAPGNGAQIEKTAPVAGPLPPAPEASPPTTQPRTESDYAALCHSIVDTLYSVGLSALDARIGLWASVSGSSDFVGIEEKFQSNKGCLKLLPPGGDGYGTTWKFAVLNPPKQAKTFKKK